MKKILVFAPHNDDEVLGVGGTIAKYAKEGNEVYIVEVTSGVQSEILKKEARASHKILGVKKAFFLDLPVLELKNLSPNIINTKIEAIIQKIKPNIVFLPHKGDMHVDHYEVFNSALVALRPVNSGFVSEIYAYETLSETEWNSPTIDNAFIPNVFIDITETIDLKIEAMKAYKSQIKEYPHPRSPEGIKALSIIRGTTIYKNNAESFMLIRKIINN